MLRRGAGKRRLLSLGRNWIGRMLVALRQLARALCRVIHVPCTPLTYGDTAVEIEPFLAGTLSMESKASNRRARGELGREIERQGILRK